MNPKFPYETVMDRVVTNALGEIIFEKDKPAYVIDEQTIEELENVIDQLKEQITNQESQITNQESIIDKLDKVIADMQAYQDENVEYFTDLVDDKFNDKLYGYSDDEKPEEDVKTGTTFYEFDTMDKYVFTGEAWGLSGEPIEKPEEPEPEPEPDPEEPEE